jgi:hypothetical protein
MTTEQPDNRAAGTSSARRKYPAPDFEPDYGAAIDCMLACSPSCPFRCPLVLGEVTT